MADYDWFRDRPESPDEAAARKWRPLGYHAIWHHSLNSLSATLFAYKCMRGCGTVVWSPEIHSKVVCTKWEPEVGA